MSGKSVLSKRDSCFACKAISTAGMYGAAAYVAYHSRKFTKKPGVVIMWSISCGFAYYGTARLFDLPPFSGSPKD